MAATGIVRARSAEADGRIRQAVEALADHFSLPSPQEPRKGNRDFKSMSLAVQTAEFLERLAEKVGVPVLEPARPVRLSANPTRGDSITLTDDPEENKRRKAAQAERERLAAIRAGDVRVKPDVDKAGSVQVTQPENPEDPDPGSKPKGESKPKGDGKKSAKQDKAPETVPESGDVTPDETQPGEHQQDETTKPGDESADVVASEGPSMAGGPVPSSVASKP